MEENRDQRQTTAPPAAGAAARSAELKRQNRWEDIVALAASLPAELRPEDLPLASDVAFALGQLGRHPEALDLWERIFALDPAARNASACAYICYDALLRHKVRKPRLDDPEPWRKKFEHWITEALRLRADSMVDRYRLGIYYASILSQKDNRALRCFAEVIALYERKPPADPEARKRLHKTYVRALYAAARSAYRLRRYAEARRYIFRCIRSDRETNHQEPLFKLFLAAKVLVTEGRLEDAERGLRLALESRHPGQRDFVYALLADVALRQGRTEDAAQWIEVNIRPHHRKPYVWRLLGDCEVRRGNLERALKLYKSALLKDRTGRHKTLLRIGIVEEYLGRTRNARRSYEQANEFRRRHFLSEDPEALEALGRLCEREGDLEKARDAYGRMAEIPGMKDRARQALERLAG